MAWSRRSCFKPASSPKGAGNCLRSLTPFFIAAPRNEEVTMASKTQTTRKIRAAKKVRMGTRRKAAVRTNGTTKSYEELFGEPKAK